MVHTNLETQTEQYQSYTDNKMITYTAEEYKRKFGEAAYNSFDKLGNGLTLPKQSFLKDAVSDLDQVGADIRNSFNRRMDNNDIAFQADQNIGSKTLQALGSGFGFVGDVGGSVLKGVAKAVLPQGGEDFVKDSIPKTIDGMAKFGDFITPNQVTDFGAKMFLKYDGLDEETKRNVNASFDVASLLAEAFGVGAGAKVAKTGVEVGLRGAREGVEQVTQEALRVGNTVKDSTSGLVDFVRPTIDAVRNAPANARVNMEAAKVNQQAIRQLPPSAQNAVRKGVDIEDLTETLSINKAQKPALKKLYGAVTDFVGGKRDINPIGAVGQPVVNKFNTLKEQTKKLGNQLDDIAEGLVGKPVNGRQGVLSTVDETLIKLRVSRTEGGVLDFVDSNLEGLGTNEDIINNIYRRLQKSTDANGLHQLKRYIDNNVDYGTTKGGFTGEAEKLIKGWRRAIDGVLDTEFPAYNKVNTELSKRLKPINDFKKFMKAATGLDEDLMNMSAGQLMRRIASNVRSNPEIRQVLRDLDNATDVKGKLAVNVESLVDFYATLEKYYPEIVGKNTFQGQIKNALDTPGGIVDKVTGVVKNVVGQTESVKRKAITEFLNDYFK